MHTPSRFWAGLSVLVAAVLTLSGCGSEQNAPGGAGSLGKVSCGGKQALNASGSTAQANAMTRFIKTFERACPGHSLTYTSNGSGTGINEFISNQTDFGGSDSPLGPIEHYAAQNRCGSPAWNLPVVFGPIAITYNVMGLSSLILDGPTVAKIFDGTITTWNDPAIQKLNSGVTLPAEPVRVVFRSDESGTTDNFQKYLDSASDGVWTRGVGKVFRGAGQGAPGNEGTSAAVKATEGAITYNEWSFAISLKLNMAKVITSAGPDAVAISPDTVGKTISGATIEGQGNDLVLDMFSFYKPTEPGAYPIVLATYEIVCSRYSDSQVAAAVKVFLQSTIGAGQNGLADNGYIPMPERFKSKVISAINTIS